MRNADLCRCVAAFLILIAPLGCLSAQIESQGPVLAFDHVTLRISPENTIPQMRTLVSGNRYELRNATLVDLIRTAWDVGADSVLGGPEWIDIERFDVITQTPPGADLRQLRGALQKLLEERFGLVMHRRSQTVRAYTITVADRARLRPAVGFAVSGCELQQNMSTAPGMVRPQVTLACTNETMSAWAQVLADLREASGYLFGYPIMDRSGLDGGWTFNLTWTPRNAMHADPIAAQGTTLFDAVEKQLGLKLNMTSVQSVVIVVDAARRPAAETTPNPALRFQTARIKVMDPSDTTPQCGHIDIRPGGQVHIDMTLRSLILESQGDFRPHRIIGSSNTLDRRCWEVFATVPVRADAPLGLNGPEWNGVDIDTLRMMLRALLKDRFSLATHIEQRPVSGYSLVASAPKMIRADPANRPECKEGLGGGEVGADGRDPRLSNPLASRLITCRNVTPADFVRTLNRSIVGLDGPIVDATSLAGRYDFAVNFSPGAWFNTTGATAVPRDSVESGLNRLISVSEALRTQLGLELRPKVVPEPVLVVDHVAGKPISGE